MSRLQHMNWGNTLQPITNYVLIHYYLFSSVKLSYWQFFEMFFALLPPPKKITSQALTWIFVVVILTGLSNSLFFFFKISSIFFFFNDSKAAHQFSQTGQFTEKKWSWLVYFVKISYTSENIAFTMFQIISISNVVLCSGTSFLFPPFIMFYGIFKSYA